MRASISRWTSAVALLSAGFCSSAGAETVYFDWFEYRGLDSVFEQPLAKGHYRNPIIAGFYPDPSVTRAGDKYYLVNSTFAYFPGIPVFESSDLVHWRQIGNVIDRPSQLNFDGLGISRGVFAPAIEFHDGTFYVINTSVDSGGNFFVTAKDPAGPWSDPRWLPQLDGIDPSFFFDDDGKTYVVNNGPPEGKPLYDGHRAIWMQEFDVAAGSLIGPRRVLVNGGVDLAKHPIWVEGPHIYKRGQWYYLICAEGGTGINHSQVVFRGRTVWGPYEPYARNPILTQRDLPADRANPIINAGHADLIEGADGSWWAVFLGSRAYGNGNYNTGRETFLLPVKWQDGWPVILEAGTAIPFSLQGPAFMSGHSQAPLAGNFTWRDEFDRPALDRTWLQIRVPKQPWFDLSARKGMLAIEPLPIGLEALANPSFLGRRQQHTRFEASLRVQVPIAEGTAAGVAAFQKETHWYFLGTRRTPARLEVFLEKRANGEVATIARASLADASQLQLKVTGNGGSYAFFYDAGAGWRPLVENDDGSILSTEVAGGFVGTVIGPYARSESITK